MATGNTSAPSNNANLLSLEKRLNAIEFDFKRMSSANDSGKSNTQFNLLTDELERISSEQGRLTTVSVLIKRPLNFYFFNKISLN